MHALILPGPAASTGAPIGRMSDAGGHVERADADLAPSPLAQRQVRARLDRLTQAVRAFEAMPADPALVPPAGEEHDAWWLAWHLGMSETLLARLVRDAGAAITVHMRGCYAISGETPFRPGPCAVLITPALRDALLAWCAAPTTRASRQALAEAVAPRRPDRDRPRGSTPDADEWRPLRPGHTG